MVARRGVRCKTQATFVHRVLRVPTGSPRQYDPAATKVRPQSPRKVAALPCYSRVTAMFRLIYRQRRRILFGMLFAALYALRFVVDAGMMPDPAFPFWFNMIAVTLFALAVAGIYGALSLIVILVFPFLRAWVNMLPFYLFCAGGISSVLAPRLGEMTGTLVFFVVLGLLSYALEGPLLDRFRLRFRTRERVSLPIKAPRRDIWQTMAPTHDALAHHFDPRLTHVTVDPDEPNRWTVNYLYPDGLQRPQDWRVRHHKPEDRLLYDSRYSARKSELDMFDATAELTLSEAPQGKTRITWSRSFATLTPREAIALWFDDDLGSQADHVRAKLEGRRDWSLAGRYFRKVANQL